MAGLAIAAAVASTSLNGSSGPGPASIPGPQNGPRIATGALALVPGQRVRSIVRHGASTTIHYRSGLVEVITPTRSIPTAHGPDATGPPAIDLSRSETAASCCSASTRPGCSKLHARVRVAPSS